MRSTCAGKRPSDLKRRPCRLLAIAALALAGAGGAAAQPREPTVVALEIRSDGPLAAGRDLARLSAVEPGRPLDRRAIRRSLRNFHASGEVGEAEAYIEPAGDGVRVIFALRARIHVAAIRFTGQSEVKPEDLRRPLPLREGEPLLEDRVVRGVFRLKDMLEEGGYFDASVRVGVEIQEERRAVVTYQVESGAPARVGSIRFEGSIAPFEEEDLTARFKAQRGARYWERTVRADAESLESWLITSGYRLAEVESPRVSYDPASREVALVYPIGVGPRFRVEVEGARLEELRKKDLLPFLDSERFDEALLLQAVDRLRRHYQERGHYRIGIETETSRGEAEFAIRLAIEPGPVYELEAVDFSGHSAVSESELRVLTASGKRRLLGAGAARLVDEVLKEDLSNIRSYYALRGFAQARVGPPEVSESGRRLAVLVPIEEGPRRRVVDLQIRGFERESEETLRRLLSLEPGGPFHPRLLDESLSNLRAHYEERGHRHAQVSADLDWNEGRTLVDVVLRVLEGPRSRVDRVILRGNRRTSDAVLRRAVRLSPGDPLSTGTLLEVQRRLYRLGIFSRVDVSLAPADPFSEERDVLIRVEEGKARRLLYGIGYDSEDGIRGLLGYSHGNLWGRAVTGRVDLRVSERDRQLRGLLRQPYLWGREIPTTFSLFAIEEVEESFTSNRRGTQIEARKLAGGIQYGLLFTYKIVEVEDPDPALRPIEIDRNLRQVQIASLTPSLLIDQRDDPLDTRRGWSAGLQTEYAFPLFAADAEFLKLFSQETIYLDLRRFGVLAGSVRLGAIEPTGGRAIEDPTIAVGLPSARVPISERFFAGGRTTHRAYRRDRLGIRGATLLVPPDAEPGGRPVPVGGNGLFLANLDLRFPIAGPVGGTLFVDSGNVWADWRDIDPGDFKTGVGVGVRYLSPIGPLRLEVGWKLDREQEEDPAVIFLSFGNPF